jgi:hypothetical protein
MDANDFFTAIDVDMLAADGYYSGLATDAIFDMVVSPLGEEYLGLFDDGAGFGSIPAKTAQSMSILDFDLGITNELGLLLMDRGGAITEAIAVPIEP